MVTSGSKPDWAEKFVHDLNVLCPGCQNPRSVSPFCEGCGAPNPHFSKDAFEISIGPFDLNLKECQEGHLEVLGEFAKTKDDPKSIYYQYPFCGTCGARVIPEPPLKD